MKSRKVRLLFSLDPYQPLLVADARDFLFNYLFAKHHHGHLIFRIDDYKTTSETETTENNTSVIKTMEWLELEPFSTDVHTNVDEAKTIRFSSRFNLYREYAHKLVEKNLAYYCFCSKETIKEMFTQQKIHGKTPHYDGRCLRMATADKDALKNAGTPYQVRLKKPEVISEVHDTVRGKLVFDPHDVADIVILRYEEIPTPALSNVIDYHSLDITYVMRGDRNKVETPKEAFLINALGFKMPEYVHLPLLLGEDRSLLSARHADQYIEDYNAKGYLPEAIINYLIEHGMANHEEEQLRTIGTLSKLFKVEDISRDPTVWNIEQLNSLNRIAIEKMKDEDIANAVAPYVKTAGFDLWAKGPNWTKDFVAMIKPSLNCFSDVKNYFDICFSAKYNPDKKAQELLKDPDAKKIVCAVENVVEKMEEVTNANFREIIDATRNEIQSKGKALTLLRIALTGQDSGPEFPKLLPVLGKIRIQDRLSNARRYIPKGMKRDS